MKIIPLGARVLVERLKISDQVKDTGIVIPSRTQQPTYKNKVLAIGDGVMRPVIAGDIVLTTQFAGDEVLETESTHFLLNEEDLLAIIKEDVEES